MTYLLEEKDGGTEFSLVTEQVLAGSKSEKSMAGGSRFIVENFKAFVETGKVLQSIGVLKPEVNVEQVVNELIDSSYISSLAAK